MPRRFGFVALLLLTLLSAEVQLFSVWSRAGLRVEASTRKLGQIVQIQRTVTTCEELQVALSDEDVGEIFVMGRIVCTRENWPDPVVVRRNVEVSGRISKLGKSGPSNTSEMLQHSINWTNVNKVVVAERAANLYFSDILMLQDEMGLAGLNINFIQTRQTASGVFAGIVMGVKSCAQAVTFFQDTLSDLPRPIEGEQRARALGDSALVIENVAIEWPNIHAFWLICNTVFQCGVNSRADESILRHFQVRRVRPVCETVSEPAAKDGSDGDIADSLSQAEIEGEGEQGSDGRRGHTSVVGTVVLVISVTGLVATITAGITYYLIFKGKKQTAASVAKTTKKGDPVSGQTDRRHDGSLPRDSFAYDLFDRTINVPLQDVEVGALLGRGGFGKVYKGTWKGTTVAIKLIEHGERLMENELRLPFEAYLSKHISHPNVVQTFLIHTRQQDSPHGVTVDTMDLNESLNQNGADKSSLMSTHDIFSNMAKGSVANDGGELFETWLVLEYCDRGSLAKAVRKGLLSHRKTGKPIMDHVLLSALDVANAMNYLHSLGITHGDLKADNVLLKSASTDRRGFFCKVSDFGLSRFLGKLEYLQTFTYGTITHMPPELLKDGILTSSVDIYSFGMLLWELLTNLQPYSEKNHGEIILAVVNEGRRPHIGPGFPDCYADLIRDCWKQNRLDRPRFPDIVRRLKQMLVNLETTGTTNAPCMTDSAGSLSRVKNGEPSWKRRGRYLEPASPTAIKLDSVEPGLPPPLPAEQSSLYYEDAPEDALLSGHSSGSVGGVDDDSNYSVSDGFKSAASQGHSSEYSATSKNSPTT